MRPQSEPPDAMRDSNWLLRLGVGLTIAWVLAQLYYIFGVVGFDRFVAEGPPSVGGFLEGAFAPLAFLWLVIGFFLQREELQRSSRAIDLQYQEMRRATEQAEAQARAIAANEQHARQEAFLRLSRLIHQQLGVRAGLLFVSSQAVAAGGPVTPEESRTMWSALGSGDEHVFARAMMGLHFTAEEDRDSWALFWSTPIRTRHSDTFLEVFGRMLDRARACDTDGLLVETLLGSTNGQLYLLIQQTRGFAPPAT
ncbi:MAG: hypothetical protein MUF70_12545 [Myxococcota bacterium]|jgi:hypothetical protein|nr:hypothetical protein [Myxococcota bacterium]